MSLERISANIVQLGWIDGLIFLVARGLAKLSRRRIRLARYYLVAQPVPPKPEPVRPSPRAPVALVEATDPLVATFPRTKEVVDDRFRRGYFCIAARCDDRFAGFLWLARGGYDEDMVRCRYEFIHPGESAWDFDVFVDPAFRTGRTFSRLWAAANDYLHTDGVRWTYSRITSANPESLRAHRRLGIRKLFSATFIFFGPVQVTLAGSAPYIHVSLPGTAGPTFQLRPPNS